MCSCENSEKKSVLPVVIMIISAISFVLGVFVGVTATKKLIKHKAAKCGCCNSGDFDADEYVRSLNLDE